mmetsp:Transcript_23466/g.27707  ORF Transcript_23466/g.27707 Transcript_23466/m.27707 type:complete len:368 (+) Transcript_23466:247-1350(+)
MAYNEDSSASGNDEPWIQWFCGLKGHEMFCEVERSYIEDGFNLYGLRSFVSNFSDCLDLILDRIGADDSDDSHLTQSACTLYGLIHARYIITAHGLDAMYNKYAAKEFGTCPLIQCFGQPVLPVGLRDEMGADTVKIFCPKCKCVYHPPPIRSRSNHGPVNHSSGNGAIDGAAFGTTFPHLFLMTFNNLVPDALSPETSYTPRVFGFRVHHIARPRNGGGTDVAVRTTTAGNSRRSYAVTPVDATAVVNGAGRAQNAGELDGKNVATGAAVVTHPQDQDAHDDKTASLQAAASLQPGKVDAEATGPTDNKSKGGSGVDGKKSKTDDSVSASKRKSKVGDGSKNSPGDTENGTAARNKRQKRQLGVSS